MDLTILNPAIHVAILAYPRSSHLISVPQRGRPGQRHLASSADDQVDAFHKYFSPDASFIHPLCYVPSRPSSRKRVIGIYLFYRAVIPETHFDVKYVAIDEKIPGVEGHLFVNPIQTPSLRIITPLTGWKPSVLMHINFHLIKSNANECHKAKTKWLIDAQEDAVQPLGVPECLHCSFTY